MACTELPEKGAELHPSPSSAGRRLDPSVAVEPDGHVAILAEGRHLAPAAVQVQHLAYVVLSEVDAPSIQIVSRSRTGGAAWLGEKGRRVL